MNRAFKQFSILAGGTPQPLIGTHLTAAVTLATVTAAKLQGGLIYNNITLTVADSSMFVGSTYANIVDPSTYLTERVRVVGAPTSTTVLVNGLQFAHPGGVYGTGSWVALGDFAQNVFAQGIAGNTGILYIGTIPQMVKATGVGVIFQLYNTASGSNPYYFSTSRQGLANTETMSQYWIDGTTGDQYLPSMGVC